MVKHGILNVTRSRSICFTHTNTTSILKACWALACVLSATLRPAVDISAHSQAPIINVWETKAIIWLHWWASCSSSLDGLAHYVPLPVIVSSKRRDNSIQAFYQEATHSIAGSIQCKGITIYLAITATSCAEAGVCRNIVWRRSDISVYIWVLCKY